MSDLHSTALGYLRNALDQPDVTFRDGQWEAIETLVEARRRMLVVQRTGWGKSMVYFLATRLMRDQGAGPTLLVSPLLALMRNQIAAAARIGVRAVTINSANVSDWNAAEEALERDEVDVLLISPERLSNEAFRTAVLSRVAPRVGLFVVDEAHCISDWGHDFRPDYRRIVRVLQALPPTVPVLATTATANDRVVADVVGQLGESLVVSRGALGRASLRLQALQLDEAAERMAWLAERLPQLDGSGIVYVRTTRDAERVAEWLQTCDIDAQAYSGRIASDVRETLEEDLLANRVKVLVATSALGMGFDKPDLAFVIHYQRPGSVVEYYQQVGRAGRNGLPAYGVLLSGEEDDAITDFFIRSAFPPDDHVSRVLSALADAEEGLTMREIEYAVNLSAGRIGHVLKLMSVLGRSPVVLRREKHGGSVKNVYFATGIAYEPDEEKREQLEAVRRAEQDELRRYTQGDECHMLFLRRALSDRDLAPCGRCAVCVGHALLPTAVDGELVQQAQRFLKRGFRPILPRKRKPDFSAIPPNRQAREGSALCIYGDAGWGAAVRTGKLSDGHFSDALVAAAVDLFQTAKHDDGTRVFADPDPTWVTCVPSLRSPDLVPSFARRLAESLGLPFVDAIAKTRDTPPQREQHNSHYRLENLRGSFGVQVPDALRGQPVLLVDDVADSRWTLALVAGQLLQTGSGPVFPLTLAESPGG